MESNKNKNLINDEFVTEKKLVLSESIRSFVDKGVKKVGTGFVTYAFKKSREFQENTETEPKEKPNLMEKFFSTANNLSLTIKNSMNDVLIEPNDSKNADQSLYQKIRRSSSSLLSIFKKNKNREPINTQPVSTQFEDQIESDSTQNDYSSSDESNTTVNSIAESENSSFDSDQDSIRGSLKSKKNFGETVDSQIKSNSDPTPKAKQLEKKELKITKNSDNKRFKVKRIDGNIEKSDTRFCPNFDVCKGKGNTSNKNGKWHLVLKNCPYVSTEFDNKELNLINNLDISSVKDYLISEKNNENNFSEFNSNLEIQENKNNLVEPNEKDLSKNLQSINPNIDSVFEDNAKSSLFQKVNLNESYMCEIEPGSIVNALLKNVQHCAIDPINLINDIESDSDSIKELQDLAGVPKFNSKNKIMKSFSLDLNNNKILLDESGELKNLLSNPRYQPNISFASEKLIDELKSSNQIFDSELKISREKVKELEKQIHSFKKTESDLNSRTESKNLEIEKLKDTIKSLEKLNQSQKNEYIKVKFGQENLIEKLKEEKSIVEEKLLDLEKKLEKKNNEKQSVPSEDEKDLKNIDQSTSNTKKCPLFQKCNGKGNIRFQNGQTHTAINSCPIFVTIGTDKKLEKKLKELTEEKTELIKLHNSQNEKIFDYEKELMSIKNNLVFDNIQEVDQLKKNIDQLEQENKKFQKEIEEKNLEIIELKSSLTEINQLEPKKIVSEFNTIVEKFNMEYSKLFEKNKKEISEKNLEISRLDEMVNTLRNQIAIEFEPKLKKYDKLKSSFEKLSDEKTSIEKKLKNFENKQSNPIEIDFKSVENMFNKISNKNQIECEEEIRRLKLSLTNTNEEKTSLIKEKETKIMDLENLIQMLQKQIDEMKLLMNISTDCEQIKEEELNSKNHQITRLNEEIENIKIQAIKEFENRDNVITTKNSEIDALNSSILNLQQEGNNLFIYANNEIIKRDTEILDLKNQLKKIAERTDVEKCSSSIKDSKDEKIICTYCKKECKNWHGYAIHCGHMHKCPKCEISILKCKCK